MRIGRHTALVSAMTIATFSLGAVLAVAVAGSASASSSLPTTTTSTTSTSTPTSTTGSAFGFDPNSPAAQFSVINGTVNAASDHEIVGSSAFPNFTTGAVDNYYSMARSHVDNSPFAEGTASPFDTGPVGQTAAAGNFQQTQYADARWPGGPDKATFGNQGGPYASAAAGEFQATADAAEASNGLSGPGLGGSKTLALPKGFDALLRKALAGWKAKWQAPAAPKKPAPKVPVPTVTVKVPKATAPAPTVPTPVATVTAPTAAVGAVTPAPPVTAPAAPTLPSTGGAAPRSLQAASTSHSAAASSTPKDGESHLTSSTEAALVPATGLPKSSDKTATTDATTTTTTGTGKTKSGPAKPYALVMSGESTLGRVSIGGGQIVIHGIHVTASITNDGTPSYKAAVSVASASIGGVPVTIDQDGVHVAGQGQGLPYQQASDSLNGALKQAGIQLFLVGPEVTTKSCDQSGTGTDTGTGGGGSGTGTTTTTGDQSGATSSCGQTGAMCDQGGLGSGGDGGVGGIGTTPSTTTPTTSTSTGNQPGTTSSCDQTGTTCGQTATGGGEGTSTMTTTTAAMTTTGTTTTTGDQAGTTGTPSWCDLSGAPPATSSCLGGGTTTGTTSTPTTTDQSTTTTTGTGDQMGTGTGMGMGSSSEQTVTATGVHVVFTQPVSPPGVPAQYVEHILGEVSVDSLVVPAAPLPDLGLSSAGGAASSSTSSCGGGRSSRKAASGTGSTGVGGASTGGGTSATGGGAASSNPLAASGSTFGSAASQPASGTTGMSVPAQFAAALRKPLWLLLAYLLWQALVVGTGWSLWNWRRGGAS